MIRAEREHSPATVEEAAALVAREGRVVFVGGGTELELGTAPTAVDAIVRTERLSRIVEYAPSDLILTAEAGVTLTEIAEVARAHRQQLALDPPLADRATVGGVVAANAFGPRRMRYGSVRDLIIGVTLVRADGVIARGGGKVVKNVAGFDLPKLVVGSLGTLGLIATATFRLHPLPEASTTLRLPRRRPAELPALVAAIRAAQLEPSSLVAYGEGRGDDVELAVRFEGFAAGVAHQVDRCRRAAQPGAADLLDDGAARAWWARHDGARTAGDLRVKVTALPTLVAEVSEAVVAPLGGVLADSTFVWYATLGIGFVSGRVQDAGAAARAIASARAALGRRGGTLTLAAAPDAVRADVDVWGAAPASLALQQRLKRRFDPEGRLAPGRFVGGI